MKLRLVQGMGGLLYANEQLAHLKEKLRCVYGSARVHGV